MYETKGWDSLSSRAKNIIEEFHRVPSAPPISVKGMAEAFGLKILAASLSPHISGRIERENENYVIRVNRYEVKVRQRFTVAHEIAHYLLHRDIIDRDGIEDTIMYRSRLKSREETEANRLAADLIMPRFLVLAKLEELNIDRHNPGEGDVEEMAESFGVSQYAMSLRLGAPHLKYKM